MLINLDKVNLPERLISDLDNVFTSFGKLEKVIMFGSRARKDNKENSDIDLAIYGIDKEEVWKLSEKIEDINTLYSFDIVVISKDTSVELIKQIKKDGVSIYEQ